MENKKILNNVIKNDNQGYAFYFKLDDNEIKKVNGYLKEEDSDKVDFDTHFRLASVTKHFIARGIVELIIQGKLKLDSCVLDVFDTLPSFFEKINIKHLLNHTSGIFDYETIPHKDDDPQIRDHDILPFLENTKGTYFEPGTEYRYSNTGYILLGLIIEKVSNMKIDEFLNEYVFKKAHITNTIVNYQGKTNISKRAYGHVLENGKLIVKDQYWCSATIGDGGIYSTVNDLNKWIDFLLNDSNKLMFEPNVLPNGVNTEYGLGMRIIKYKNEEIYYHCGDTIGTNTIILFSKKMRLIFLTNLGNIDTTIIKDNLLKYLEEIGY